MITAIVVGLLVGVVFLGYQHLRMLGMILFNVQNHGRTKDSDFEGKSDYMLFEAGSGGFILLPFPGEAFYIASHGSWSREEWVSHILHQLKIEGGVGKLVRLRLSLREALRNALPHVQDPSQVIVVLHPCDAHLAPIGPHMPTVRILPSATTS